MDRDSMATDVRYALGQLRGLLNGSVPVSCTVADRAERAIDALERVEAALDRSQASDLATYGEAMQGHDEQDEPRSDVGLPCDTGLQDQIGERQYDYGCYGT